MDQNTDPDDIIQEAEDWLRRNQTVADQRKRLEEHFEQDPQRQEVLEVFDRVAAWTGDPERLFPSNTPLAAVAKFCIFYASEFTKSVPLVTENVLARIFVRMFLFGYKLAVHETNS